MATAQTLIDRAIRLIMAVEAGQNPTTEERNNGLVALNDMLESWSTERFQVHTVTQENLTLTPADGSYTMGPSGNLNTTRPVRIESAFIRSNSIDYDLALWDNKQFSAIPAKTSQGLPEVLFPDMAATTAVLNLYPVPDQAYALYLNSIKIVAAFAALSTTEAMPPGSRRAVVYNLALEIAPEFGKTPSPLVVKIARDSKRNLGKLNSPTPVLRMPSGLIVGWHKSDIRNDV